MNQIKVKSVSGIDVFVGEDGKFFAEINGRSVSRAQLRDLEKLIMADAVPVVALQVVRDGIVDP